MNFQIADTFREVREESPQGISWEVAYKRIAQAKLKKIIKEKEEAHQKEVEAAKATETKAASAAPPPDEDLEALKRLVEEHDGDEPASYLLSNSGKTVTIAKTSNARS
jgi:hypothetical protein